MTKEYSYHFYELAIVPEDLHEFLGFENGVVPEPFPDYINETLQKADELCEIRGGYSIFNQLDIDTKNATITINNAVFNPSKIVSTQLKDSKRAALFLCTAGAGITDYANEVSAQGDPMLAYVFDVLGSVTVEKAMDKMETSLKLDLEQVSEGISDRFSPGYCEWSVGEQQLLFSLLPKGFCSISLSDSSLMHPIKSVSGIIGIGPGLKQKGYQCNWCTDTNCLYGKIRRNKKQKK
jgi:hypothetical protein